MFILKNDEPNVMKQVLIVSDDTSLLRCFQDKLGPYKARFALMTASSGEEAIEKLNTSPIHLVVTDSKIPEVKDSELLYFLKKSFPEIPAIVMTAFATPEIEKQLSQAGIIAMLKKPVDFDELTHLILSLLDQRQTGGTLSGISLPSFMQLIEMDCNTCLIEIKDPNGLLGLLYFNQGSLYDAVFGDVKGEEAVYRMLAIDNVKISFRNFPNKKLKQRINTSLVALIMEGLRRKDESQEQTQMEQPDTARQIVACIHNDIDEKSALNGGYIGQPTNPKQKGDKKMAEISQVLEKFKIVDGFQAVGAFSPNGEMVAEINVAGINLSELGALANDVLLKAQKTTEMMNVGRGQLVHVEAPKAHVIARYLNEATDFAATSSGRAHVHVVLIIEKEGNVAMGKMKIASVIQELAEFFR